MKTAKLTQSQKQANTQTLYHPVRLCCYANIIHAVPLPKQFISGPGPGFIKNLKLRFSSNP